MNKKQRNRQRSYFMTKDKLEFFPCPNCLKLGEFHFTRPVDGSLGSFTCKRKEIK